MGASRTLDAMLTLLSTAHINHLALGHINLSLKKTLACCAPRRETQAHGMPTIQVCRVERSHSLLQTANPALHSIAKLGAIPADEDLNSLLEDSEPKLDEYAGLASSEMWLRSAHSKPCPDSTCATEQLSNHHQSSPWHQGSTRQYRLVDRSTHSLFFVPQYLAMWRQTQVCHNRAVLRLGSALRQ